MLRFDKTFACRLQNKHSQHFAQPDSMLGVSAAGLAAICAAHGHSSQLFELVSELDAYRCPVRSFMRWTKKPDRAFDCEALRNLRRMSVEEGVFLDEVSLLQLFGAENRSKPSSLVQSVINNPDRRALVRPLFDTQTQQLAIGAKNLSRGRVAVLSPEAASCAFRSLLSSAVPDKCTMRELLETAAAQSGQFSRRRSQSLIVRLGR